MLFIPSSGKQMQHQNIKHTERPREDTADRDPLAFTSAAPFSVSELEEESFETMIIVKCKCG